VTNKIDIHKRISVVYKRHIVQALLQGRCAEQRILKFSWICGPRDGWVRVSIDVDLKQAMILPPGAKNLNTCSVELERSGCPIRL